MTAVISSHVSISGTGTGLRPMKHAGGGRSGSEKAVLSKVARIHWTQAVLSKVARIHWTRDLTVEA